MKSNAVSVSFYFGLSQSDALQNSKTVLLIQGTCLRYTTPALLWIGRSRGKWQDEDAITRDCGKIRRRAGGRGCEDRSVCGRFGWPRKLPIAMSSGARPRPAPRPSRAHALPVQI